MFLKICRIMSVLLVAAVLLFSCVTANAVVYMLGDVDNDEDISIVDVTCIQRVLGRQPLSTAYSELAADIDRDGVVDITDATYIQRWLVGIDAPNPIGAYVYKENDPDHPNVDPSTQQATDEEGWSTIIVKP